MGEATIRSQTGAACIAGRNLDLTKAIHERAMQEKITAADYRLMALWASEIALNCNMMLALDKTVKMMGE